MICCDMLRARSRRHECSSQTREYLRGLRGQYLILFSIRSCDKMTTIAKASPKSVAHLGTGSVQSSILAVRTLEKQRGVALGPFPPRVSGPKASYWPNSRQRTLGVVGQRAHSKRPWAKPDQEAFGPGFPIGGSVHEITARTALSTFVEPPGFESTSRQIRCGWEVPSTR